MNTNKQKHKPTSKNNTNYERSIVTANNKARNIVVNSADYRPNTLFATPDNAEDLQAYIDSYPKEHRAMLYTVINMHWNLICANITGKK